MNFVTVNFKVGAKNPSGFLFEITLQLKFEAKNPRCILQFLGTGSGRSINLLPQTPHVAI